MIIRKTTELIKIQLRNFCVISRVYIFILLYGHIKIPIRTVCKKESLKKWEVFPKKVSNKSAKKIEATYSKTKAAKSSPYLHRWKETSKNEFH